MNNEMLKLTKKSKGATVLSEKYLKPRTKCQLIRLTYQPMCASFDENFIGYLTRGTVLPQCLYIMRREKIN
ncbi:hypothetical protein HHI36_002974 [Cryptolaemus montrouzieri]|uniref:Uncharacterized protein n=1 Tax=Cryptolaemus montrouzieri TaxID=559131 RepID=A0ABD2PCJ2_9CUCU